LPMSGGRAEAVSMDIDDGSERRGDDTPAARTEAGDNQDEGDGRVSAGPAGAAVAALAPRSAAAPAALPGRPILRDELLLVLGGSLLASAAYSLANMFLLPLRGGRVALFADTPLIFQLLGITVDLVPVLLAIHFLHRDGETAADIGLDRSRPGRDMLQGLLLAAVIGSAGLALYAASVTFGLNRGVIPAPPGGAWWVPLVVLLGSARSAVLEEVLVAGYLLRRLDQLGWRPNAALVASALLRASYHLYQGWGGFVGNFAMGLLFGRFYQRTGRTVPLIVAHFLLDTVAGLGYLVVRRLQLDWSWLPN
jgi:membrane protease YdiL (CAAX protease family)